ncbi:hypothetical protein [Pontibacter aquaedesilientis]|nr:hypothetical protein [Pontibacter aquaedesilientis]
MKAYYQNTWETRGDQPYGNNGIFIKYRHKDDPFILLDFVVIDDVCVRITRLMPKEMLSMMISTLNEENYRENENVWVTKDMKTKITAKVEKDKFLVLIYDPIL